MFSYLACLRVMAWFEKQSLRYVNSMNWIVIEGMERKGGGAHRGGASQE